MGAVCIPRHDGETIIVLGNGPSLKAFDFGRLDGFTTIGVNRIPEIFDPNYLVFLDSETWQHNKQLIIDSKATGKYCPDTIETGGTCKQFKRYWPQILDPIIADDWDKGLFFGYTSIMPAINLAYLMKASKVVLLGVDMHDDSHYYDESPKPILDGFKVIIKHFVRLKSFCLNKANGFQVLNGNPDSNVKIFDVVRVPDDL